MDCNVTSPISTNQVIDVGLFKPACASFSGNTLNDWLKWLSEKQCEIDWSTFDLSCLDSLLQEKTNCTQTQKVVIQSILDSICALKETSSDEVRQSVSTSNSWVADQTIQVLKKGSIVHLKGVVSGGNVSTAICTLPQICWPAYSIKIPIRHDNTYSTLYQVYIEITSAGVVKLDFTGVGPIIASSQSIFLDGISYFV